MKGDAMAAKLTDKQKAFADYYIISMNATDAYKRAYPNVKTDNAAAVNGNKLLRNAKIQEYLSQNMQTRADATIATQDDILNKLTEIAFNDGYKTKDQLRALELLGKRYALWTERVETENVNTNFEITIIGDDDET
jgi:phage terminase small subunit